MGRVHIPIGLYHPSLRPCKIARPIILILLLQVYSFNTQTCTLHNIAVEGRASYYHDMMTILLFCENIIQAIRNNANTVLSCNLLLYLIISVFPCTLNLHIGVRARGAEGAPAPQTRAKPLFFGQKLTFSGKSQQPKLIKNMYFLYLLNEKKRNSFCRARECPKSRDFY